MSKLEEAKKKLDDAVIVVTRSAQVVADDAEYHNHKTGGPMYLVNLEDMDELKAAMKAWKAATVDFLLEVQKETRS